MKHRHNLDTCPICGQPFDEYWGYKYFVGGTKPIIICGECHALGKEKCDFNVMMRSIKAKKKKAMK